MNNCITFILPVRIDSDYRRRNLNAVLEYYGVNPNYRFIVIEADMRPMLSLTDLKSENIDYYFVHDENPIFHRTKYINKAFRIVATDVAAIWDVDVICRESQILKAAEFIYSDKQTIVYPYDGKMWDIDVLFSELFREKLDISILSDYPQNKHLMNGYYSVGGAFLVNVEAYKEIGWENENFLGWGPEDVERYKRVEIIRGIPPMRVDGELYHLFHPRGINSGPFNKNLAYSTKKEYCKVCSMTKGELIRYVESWNWKL